MTGTAHGPIVFMFSGQGSQYFGMAKTLILAHAGFARHLRELDDVTRTEVGCSILDVIFNPSQSSEAPFDRLLYSHPAILMVELALARVLRDAGVEPDYVLGASLGEFAAAVVAHAMSTEDALRAVVQSARWVEEHCPPGGMIAILGDPALAAEPWVAENCEVASVHFNGHFVVSGTTEGLSRLVTALREHGILYHELPVRYPFHSSHVECMREGYESILKRAVFHPPTVSMISCVHGRQLAELSPGYIWKIAREPIRFREAISTLEQTGQHPVYLDLGPSGSLVVFLSRILEPRARTRMHALSSPFHRDASKLREVITRYGHGRCSPR